MRKSIEGLIHRSRQWVDLWWYPFFVFLCAFVDVFIYMIPSDGIMISSILVNPKKTFQIAAGMTLGSFLGGTILALLFQWMGPEFIDSYMPTIAQTWIWAKTHAFFVDYGLYVVFLAAASPLSFQPALFFAVVSKSPFIEILAYLLVGRILKNTVIALVASRAPQLISKLWGVNGEFEEIRQLK